MASVQKTRRVDADRALRSRDRLRRGMSALRSGQTHEVTLLVYDRTVRAAPDLVGRRNGPLGSSEGGKPQPKRSGGTFERNARRIPHAPGPRQCADTSPTLPASQGRLMRNLLGTVTRLLMAGRERWNSNPGPLTPPRGAFLKKSGQ